MDRLTRHRCRPRATPFHGLVPNQWSHSHAEHSLLLLARSKQRNATTPFMVATYEGLLPKGDTPHILSKCSIRIPFNAYYVSESVTRCYPFKSLEERLVSSRTNSDIGDSRNSADEGMEPHIFPLEWQLEFGPRYAWLQRLVVDLSLLSATPEEECPPIGMHATDVP
jgi:hypothetical protein